MTNTGAAKGDWDNKVWRRAGSDHHGQWGRLRFHQEDQGGQHYQQHPIHWGSWIPFISSKIEDLVLVIFVSLGGWPHREDWWGEPGWMQTLWGGEKYLKIDNRYRQQISATNFGDTSLLHIWIRQRLPIFSVIRGVVTSKWRRRKTRGAILIASSANQRPLIWWQQLICY